MSELLEVLLPGWPSLKRPHSPHPPAFLPSSPARGPLHPSLCHHVAMLVPTHPALWLTGTTCANGLGMELRTSCSKVVSKSPRVTRVSKLWTAGTPPWDRVRSFLARGQVLARWGSQSVQQESPHLSPVRATAKADTIQRARGFSGR